MAARTVTAFDRATTGERCPRCGVPMRIVGFVIEPRVIARLLEHLRRRASADRPLQLRDLRFARQMAPAQ